jgi:Ca-activated chloride channel family protein
MILRDSEHKGNGTFGTVLEWAQEGKGSDPNGYRAGFIELVRKAQAQKKS